MKYKLKRFMGSVVTGLNKEIELPEGTIILASEVIDTANKGVYLDVFYLELAEEKSASTEEIVNGVLESLKKKGLYCERLSHAILGYAGEYKDSKGWLVFIPDEGCPGANLGEGPLIFNAEVLKEEEKEKDAQPH